MNTAHPRHVSLAEGNYGSRNRTKMVYPRTMYRIKKAAAAIYCWDRPLLTFIYPGFDCGSWELVQTGALHTPNALLQIDREARRPAFQKNLLVKGCLCGFHVIFFRGVPLPQIDYFNEIIHMTRGC